MFSIVIPFRSSRKNRKKRSNNKNDKLSIGDHLRTRAVVGRFLAHTAITYAWGQKIYTQGKPPCLDSCHPDACAVDLRMESEVLRMRE